MATTVALDGPPQAFGRRLAMCKLFSLAGRVCLLPPGSSSNAPLAGTFPESKFALLRSVVDLVIGAGAIKCEGSPASSGEEVVVADKSEVLQAAMSVIREVTDPGLQVTG